MGNKVANLVEAAQEASMLVVGSHGHSVAGQMFVGSVSQSLVRHVEQPVVVVRDPRTADAGRIVVGFGAHGLSKRAFEFACHVAELTGEKVLAVRAWHPGRVEVDRYGYVPPSRTGAVDEQEAALEYLVEEMRGRHPAIGIDGQLAVHVPAGRALVEASSSASLVVVGGHAQTAVAEALQGSVTHDVLHKAHCTVAVVK
jgi:nucleotide-binding universal stress UspA family protein